MPDAPERRGETPRSSPTEKHGDSGADQPNRPGQPGDLASRDRAGKISPRTPDQAEGERDERD